MNLNKKREDNSWIYLIFVKTAQVVGLFSVVPGPGSILTDANSIGTYTYKVYKFAFSKNIC